MCGLICLLGLMLIAVLGFDFACVYGCLYLGFESWSGLGCCFVVR